MRVAIFTEYYYPFISGVVTHIEILSQGLRDAGHEVLIVTLDPKARRHYIKDNVLYCPAIPVKKLYGYGVAMPTSAVRLKFIKKFNPDIIHLHTEYTMGLFALNCAKKLKKPVVYTLHTMYDDYLFYVFPKQMVEVAKPMAHAYFRKIASKAEEIIGPSVKVAEYLRSFGVPRHINIIPNTVDFTDFLGENVDSQAVEAAKTALGIQPGDTALCFVGRLGKEKSIDLLIDMFCQTFLHDKQFKLFIIGEGPEKEALGTQIGKHGAGEQIKLLGRIDHDKLPPYYQACNLFATASLSEMNSISMLEATASGLFVVQRLDLYNRDQIKSGVNGEVFNTPAEFAEIVRGQAALSQKQRQQRRDTVTAYAKQYGPREFTQAVLNVYERAVDSYIKKTTK